MYNGDFMVSDSTKYYNANPERKRKKNATQAKFNKKPSQVANRVRLNKINRNDPKSKVGDGKDVSHKKNGDYTLEAQARNRARKGKA